jgi:hypothetical protein
MSLLEKFMNSLVVNRQVWGHGEVGYIIEAGSIRFSSHEKEEVERILKMVKEEYDRINRR